MMGIPKKIDRPTILEIDIAGESLVLGITNIKDSLTMFHILDANGYNVTLSPLTNNKEKKDEQVPSHTKGYQ